MSDGMGREPAYLSSHATNRYFIPNWGIFYKWYKDTRNKIVEVKVDGLAASCQKDPKEEAHLPAQSSTETKPSCVRILVELRMTNGLHISQKNLNYQELKQLIEKLEGLCLM